MKTNKKNNSKTTMSMKYTCKYCGNHYDDVDTFQNHNNGKCFNEFAKRQIEKVMSQKVEERSAHDFSQLLQTGTNPLPKTNECNDCDEILSQRLIFQIQNDKFSCDTLKSLLSNSQLQQLDELLQNELEHKVNSFIPWYLLNTSDKTPEDMLPLPINPKFSKTLVFAINQAIYTYTTLTRIYVETDVFDVYNPQIDQQIEELFPSLYSTIPVKIDDITAFVLQWLRKNEVILDECKFTVILRNDTATIKADLQKATLVLSHLHKFYYDKIKQSKKIEFLHLYVSSGQYRKDSLLV
ncbi:hypothetical protein EIN_096120 [Entamoeba invadens IP1]|uniref:C2H2-type domain-containing protein n=1 Tax=Entamoeba invadens IP1 TaxID=370355 RepID=A0A0A1U0D9_ENTIV|nr:hypothetical protein EIN_096120 [Entamoeba invadens IP1]ELP87355.1 hypothetical protein EIN_096120 [Entamoeba invadens IP1]|eukprot:XP_004254126.1 hypothetical protein EIN_096120 [Entamoeba invadens IP1]